MATHQTPIALQILIATRDTNLRLSLCTELQAQGHLVYSWELTENVLNEATARDFDLIFIDCSPENNSNFGNGEFLHQLSSSLNSLTCLVLLKTEGTQELVPQILSSHFVECLPEAFDAAQLQQLVKRVTQARQLRRKIESLQIELAKKNPDADLVTDDPAMIATLSLARRVATSQATVIVRGEAGTCKVELAHAIHNWSDRAAEPFTTVVCNTDSADITEVELFGSAPTAQKTFSKVELCEGGTLVLEEIGNLPRRLQPAILRLLKDQEFERPEDSTRRRCNVRVIATSSTDLEQAVARGDFRADLLLAINVVQIDLPALRQRQGDIPLLSQHYLQFFGCRIQHEIAGFSAAALHILTHYRWPGNLRELRDVVERATLLCDSDQIEVAQLPSNMLNSRLDVSVGDLISLAAVEEAHIRRVVQSARSLRQAAIILGIDSGTITRRMKRYETARELSINPNGEG